MKTPPKITIGQNEPAGSYALAGFDDFDLWMLRNDTIYCAASKNAEAYGMNESDRLRYVLAAMAHKAMRAEALLVEHIERTGLPIGPIPPNTQASNTGLSKSSE